MIILSKVTTAITHLAKKNIVGGFGYGYSNRKKHLVYTFKFLFLYCTYFMLTQLLGLGRYSVTVILLKKDYIDIRCHWLFNWSWLSRFIIN